MADKTANILAQCIADIKSGNVSLEDCLAKYPYLRGELESLLKIALAIEHPPEVVPATTFKIRARANVLAKIQPQRSVTKGRWLRYSFVTDMDPTERRFKMAAIIIAIVVAVASVGGGTAYASQDALPGDMLYPEKKFIENARLFFAFSDQTKAETHLRIADTRIDELSRLPEDRNRFIERLTENYQYNLELGLDLAEQRIEQGGNASGLLYKFSEGIAHHQEVLQTVYAQVPEEAQAAIEHAINVSGQGIKRARHMVTTAHLENAAQRMNRISEMARAGKTDEVAELLREYDEEVASFMEAAGETEDVEALLEEARERLLLLFDEVLATVPDQAHNAIANAKAKTIKGFDEASEAVGKGEGLKDAWEEFEFDWEEFLPQWQGELEPGSDEWQQAWEKFKPAPAHPGW